MSHLSVRIEKMGLKNAHSLIDPYILISVKGYNDTKHTYCIESHSIVIREVLFKRYVTLPGVEGGKRSVT